MIDYGKKDVLGVLIDAVDMGQAVERVTTAALLRQPYAVSALAVHGVVEASRDPALKAALNNFHCVLPDGQPVRWALNRLYKLDVPDKVPGPSLVEELLRWAAEEGYGVHFHGSTPATLALIREELARRFGGSLAVTTTPSRFRRVGEEELSELVASINETGAHLCFVGLGCPRQERFVAAAANSLKMPAIAVGAAFDYLAGNIDRAPRLLQRAGLEWLYRTLQEPRRLARRYLVTNTAFVAGVARQWSRQRLLRRPAHLAPSAPPVAAALVDA
ncbi:MAG TPA: WecB/TagA/CpsF family glycosyltransferase [Acidimicrobiales bacterium]|nr:WecB/TagA/CpsF family glycosyltransferase [Acidimicrobiales bacterium]